jgi:hypothetical protein
MSRRWHPRRWLGVAAFLPLLLLSTGCDAATATSGFPTTGPLFLPGLAAHTCTASVVKSPTHDLLITAAHCVYGTGIGMSFIPGSVNGSAPYGRWTVTAAYVDASWRTSHNPLRDVAFLRVAAQRVNGSIRSVEQLTGGNTLIRTPLNVGAVSVPAYTLGVGVHPSRAWRAPTARVPIWRSIATVTPTASAVLPGSAGRACSVSSAVCTRVVAPLRRPIQRLSTPPQSRPISAR